MEVLRLDRRIDTIQDPSELSFSDEEFYLWVIHANKIPPHLGVSKGNYFFSLKAKGRDDAFPVDKMLPILKNKEIATVFYRISGAVEPQNLSDVFSLFKTTIPGQVTCLDPIKMLFNNQSATWLKELLADVEDKGWIEAAYGWQLPANFQGIPDYDPSDIHRRLEQLNND